MRRAAACFALLALGAPAAPAQLASEPVGRVDALPAPPRPHWVWAADILLRRSTLVDLESGEFLGMISTGYFAQAAVFPRGRSEFYVPETYYSRGSRGVRTDVVTVYDPTSLAPVAEVVIPPKRSINILPSANAALTDDDRFLAVFNLTPATSLSIVDVVERRFAAEIETPGCSLVYAAGARRFLMLCSDGALLAVSLDERGGRAAAARSEPFFDPETDPVTEKAVRYGNTWLFVSFEGLVYPVDVSGAAPRVGQRWSLLSERDRRDGWRVGGRQHLAVHRTTGRLFSLMHQGGVDSHKDPGTELWVYDLETRERAQRIELRHPGFSLLGTTIGPGPGSGGFSRRLWGWLLDYVVPNPGLQVVQVTQDDAPLLVTGSEIGGSLAVYDATSGRFLRRVSSGNLTAHVVQAPWGAP